MGHRAVVRRETLNLGCGPNPPADWIDADRLAGPIVAGSPRQCSRRPADWIDADGLAGAQAIEEAALADALEQAEVDELLGARLGGAGDLGAHQVQRAL